MPALPSSHLVPSELSGLDSIGDTDRYEIDLSINPRKTMAKVFIFGMAGVIGLGLLIGLGLVVKFNVWLFAPKKDKEQSGE